MGIVAWASERLTSLEARWGLAVAALVAGLGLFGLSAIYVAPSFVPLGHGEAFAAMSEHPLRVCSSFQYRLLSPLMGWALGLRGARFIWFPWLGSIALLSAIYAFHRRHQWTATEALASAAVIASTTPILTTLRWAGNPDSPTFLLIGGAILAARRRSFLWALFVCLGILNHEMTLFVVPVIVAAHGCWAARRGRLRAIVELLVSVVVAFALRTWLLASCQHDAFTVSFYLSQDNIRYVFVATVGYVWLGVFEAFKLVWILPVAGAVMAWKLGDRARARWIVLCVACAASQMIFGTDTSRLLGLAFPAVIAGAMSLRSWQPRLFARGLWALVGVNLLVPQYFVGQFIVPMFPWPVRAILVRVLRAGFHQYW